MPVNKDFKNPSMSQRDKRSYTLQFKPKTQISIQQKTKEDNKN
jgi:hypothetical protein